MSTHPSNPFRDHARAPATTRAYASDWRDFQAFAGDEALPASPETVAAYLADRAGTLKPATLSRRLVAIAEAHRAAGHDTPTRHPTVTETFRGIRRSLGVAQQGKAPITLVHLQRIVETLDDSLTGLRDRALILVGFAGAFRRSELAALDLEDLAEHPEGIAIRVRRSKTDQEGRGTEKGIPYHPRAELCPVRALAAWVEAAGISGGPLWRSVDRHGHVGQERLHPASVNGIVKRSLERAGVDPEKYGAHSLRAGFVTAAWEGGLSELEIAEQTGHRSLQVLRGYIRSRSPFRRNAAARLFGLTETA
ncbi:MAG: site-specific integrase [Actinomycetota bacterium]|nr:site-specific integrase [Actinomycetota bacterium]